MKLVLALVLAFTAQVAFAEESIFEASDAELQVCLDVPENQNTIGMIGCMIQAEERGQALVDSKISQLVATGDAELAKRVQQSESSWQSYVSSQCSVEGWESAGGSLERVIIASCRYDMVKIRFETLQKLYEQWSGINL